MKLFKFRQVDAKTGISVAIEKPREGPTNPSLPGLTEIFDTYNYYKYASVDDTATPDPENFILEITEAELTVDVQGKVNNTLAAWKSQVYQNEKELRQLVFGKYDDTATSSGIYKYNEAVKFLADGTPSLDITTEASVREVTETEIAEKIVVNHEAFRVKEAKIAGLRGKILDRLDAYTFDATDALGSWDELMKRMEVIGQREPGPGPNPGQEPDLDVKVGYYAPDLATRWQYMNK
jgi:hypothetical protein